MQYQKADQTYVVKLEPGEPVINTLTEFCQEQSITNASFTAIGAVRDVRCGYYALQERRYYFTNYPDLVEVVSLTGNVMQKDAQPFLHVHALFSDTKNQVFGGHVEEMTVGVTLEVILQILSTQIERRFDDDIGLYLLDCGS